MPTTSEPLPELPPPVTRHGVIQGDLFCTCGYNLHAQTVTWDERLSIPVVRCSECGRWHAAAEASAATRPWLARLGTLAAVVWTLGILACVGFVLLGTFGTITGRINADMAYIRVDDLDRPVSQTYDPQQQTLVVTLATGGTPTRNSRMVYAPYEHPVFTDDRLGLDLVTKMFLYALTAAGGLTLGVISASATWHLQGWKRLWPVPFLLAAAGLVMLAADLNDFSTGFIVREVSLMTAAAAGALLLGLWIGRPLTRAVLTLLLPPRARQAVAFLWLRDGKALPAA